MAGIIDLNGISKEYRMPGGNVQALKSVSLSLKEGEFTSVVGASGSGKSTLLYLLGLLISPTAGYYRFCDRPMEKLSDGERSAIRGSQIGFIFQSFHLVPQFTVVKNVLMGARYRGEVNGNGIDFPRRARELLDRVGLSHRLNHRPGELSNGEMQRVAIARALLCEPRILLADEPTGNLDENTGNEIFSLLDSMHKEGKTVILVTHDLQLAARTPRKITLRDGEVIS
jgi:putative ABC transport system ATP-binding protein